MKRVMVIAGGTWQVPLIKKVKSLGYEVVNSNLYEDSIESIAGKINLSIRSTDYVQM